MNTFAHIKLVAQYEKISYYSVVLENEGQSMFENFIQKHESENKNKLYHIVKWIEQLGKYGARQNYFRPEGKLADTSALPPSGINKEPSYIENGKKKANNLRLYCLRANEHVVFLFDGDIKTTQKAQDCPNVAKHFVIANKITKAIDKAFNEKQIRWDSNFQEIEFETELIIKL